MTLDGTLDVTVRDGAVAFSFVVTNAGTDPVTLTFQSGKVADVAVYADGVETWRWSKGQMFTQAVETRTLAPDETLIHEVTWDDPPPGNYVAEATLTAENAKLTEREAFQVP